MDEQINQTKLAFYCDDILLEYWSEERSHGVKVPPVLLSPFLFSPMFPNLFPIEELPKYISYPEEPLPMKRFTGQKKLIEGSISAVTREVAL